MEIFLRMGARRLSKIFPLHHVCGYVEGEILANLPGIHALTGCDTTSKIGSKTMLFKRSLYLNLIDSFGIRELDHDMMSKAELFLLSVLQENTIHQSFDEMRYNKYHQMKILDFSKLVCSTDSVNLHIKRAYLQSLKWYNSHSPPSNYP